MRFTAEHRFPVARDAVAEVLRDPGFYRTLELPDLQLLEVQPIETPDPTAAASRGGAPKQNGLLLRYEFVGTLDPVFKRLLGGERLTWSQEVHVLDASGGQLTFAAEANPRLLHGHAVFVLEPEQTDGAAGESTVRRLEGEVTVAIPVVGAMAERRIVPGVRNRLDVEAEAVRERLSRGG